jgi:hypothetical protein
MFYLDREKIDYANLMAGVWQLTAEGASPTSTTAQINGTMMAMCGGATGLYYSLSLINGSYPTVSVKGSIMPSCTDKAYSILLYSSSFLTVSSNRTQIFLYDPSAK